MARQRAILALVRRTEKDTPARRPVLPAKKDPERCASV